jgi:type II secretory pathway pseudopilin PulG
MIWDGGVPKPSARVKGAASKVLRCAGDAGDTLVEVLITLVVISLCGVSLMTAFSSSIRGSAQHRNLAANDVVLRTAAESAFSYLQQQQSPGYAPCATSATYQAKAGSPQWGVPSTKYTATLTVQDYWIAGAWSASPPGDCPDPSIYPPQQIQMVVTAPNGTTDTTSFVVYGPQGTVTPPTNLSVTGVTPSFLGQGAKVQNLTITGTGFVNGASVLFSGVGISVVSVGSVSTDNGVTSLPVTVSVAVTTAPGQYSITVTNPDLTTDTSAAIFTVNPAPTVTAASPSVYQGEQNVTITVTGTGFISGAIASFPASSGVTVTSTGVTTWVNSTTVTVPVNVSQTATIGPVDVTVTNADGSLGIGAGVLTVTTGVTITSTAPSPCEPLVHDGTVTCTITGSGFNSNSVVTISGSAATNVSYAYIGPTTMTVTATGAGGSGNTGDITVTDPSGASATLTGGFKNA